MSQFPPPPPPPPPHVPPGPAGPPLTLGYASPPPVRADLRTIAVRQRAIMYCILAYIVLVVAQVTVPGELHVLHLIVGLVTLAVLITAAVFVFMLSLSVYNTAAGIVLGILTLVPLLGIFILLVINAKATKILRQHGIRVGLMGASLRQVPPPGEVPTT